MLWNIKISFFVFYYTRTTRDSSCVLQFLPCACRSMTSHSTPGGSRRFKPGDYNTWVGMTTVTRGPSPWERTEKWFNRGMNIKKTWQRVKWSYSVGFCRNWGKFCIWTQWKKSDILVFTVKYVTLLTPITITIRMNCPTGISWLIGLLINTSDWAISRAAAEVSDSWTSLLCLD